MDLKDISITKIHKTIESTLNLLKQQHKEIKELTGSPSDIQTFVEEILEPACKIAHQYTVGSNTSLKRLLSLLEPIVVSSITGSAHVINTVNKDTKNIAALLSRKNSDSCVLPPVTQPQGLPSPKARPSPPTCVRYPAINPSLTQSPTGSRSSSKTGSPYHRVTPPRVSSHIQAESNSRLTELHEKLHQYVKHVEDHTSTLQTSFSSFTQRVLVPLQTFCKQPRARPKCNSASENATNESRTESQETLIKNNLHQSEFTIVQTMNQIRQLLWPVGDCGCEHLFAVKGISKAISDQTDCTSFSVVRILPDVLQKFSVVIDLASMWLKRDQFYIENAKCGLRRAHRRYTKTERMWQETRQNHRHLVSEWDHTTAEVNTNEIRLKALEHDIEMLRDDLSKSQDQRRTLEIKLRDPNETMDHLRARHQAIRKRINVFSRKIEGRERNYEFMKSRVLSMKADQEALQEKLRISEEYANSLQEKMQKLYSDRAAWHRRYQDKTDPEVLKRRFETARLRIPLPTLREKTFVLKTRIENLREAINIVSERLERSEIHWSVLCQHLLWPEHFLLDFPDIKKQSSKQHMIDSDDTSSDSSASSTSGGKGQPKEKNRKTSERHLQKVLHRIEGHIKDRCVNGSRQQCMFMLKLWLQQNGENASLEQLVHALQASQMNEVLTHLHEYAK